MARESYGESRWWDWASYRTFAAVNRQDAAPRSSDVVPASGHRQGHISSDGSVEGLKQRSSHIAMPSVPTPPGKMGDPDRRCRWQGIAPQVCPSWPRPHGRGRSRSRPWRTVGARAVHFLLTAHDDHLSCRPALGDSLLAPERYRGRG